MNELAKLNNTPIKFKHPYLLQYDEVSSPRSLKPACPIQRLTCLSRVKDISLLKPTNEFGMNIAPIANDIIMCLSTGQYVFLL